MKLWLAIGSSVGALMLCSGAFAGQIPAQGTPAAGDKTASAPKTIAGPRSVRTTPRVVTAVHAAPPLSRIRGRVAQKLAQNIEKAKSEIAKRQEELAAAHVKSIAVQCVGRPETGSAAWYGGHYIGQRTTSGERLDTIHPTAAHRTLPLNSLARVTNLRNGRSVVVRVTDRGPVAHALLIDMSPSAADELQMKEAGVVPVRVEQVVEVPTDTK
jgi:rare lipoprotein A (peptidoglycan hydrolase)